MSHDLRVALEHAEAELRLALMAERADIKGAGMRRLRAEILVDNARRAMLVSDAKVRREFGPGASE